MKRQHEDVQGPNKRPCKDTQEGLVQNIPQIIAPPNVHPEVVVDFMVTHKQTPETCRELLELLNIVDQQRKFMTPLLEKSSGDTIMDRVNFVGRVVQLHIIGMHPPKKFFLSCLASLDPWLWFETICNDPHPGISIKNPLNVAEILGNEKWVSTILTQMTNVTFLKYFLSVEREKAVDAFGNVNQQYHERIFKALSTVKMEALLLNARRRYVDSCLEFSDECVLTPISFEESQDTVALGTLEEILPNFKLDNIEEAKEIYCKTSFANAGTTLNR